MGDWLQVCAESPRHRYTDAGLIEREGTGVVRAPDKLAEVRTTIARYGDLIEEKCKRAGFPAAWMVGLIAKESGGNPGVSSQGVGARGLTQMMPATAKGLGLDPDRLFEPAYSIDAALLYMAGQVKRYGSLDLPLLAGAYNAGSRRCAATTSCKTAGVKDGTTATNSWGLIEDCYKGTGSRYVERVVGAANEALLMGYGTGAPPGTPTGGASINGALSDSLVPILTLLSIGALAAATTFYSLR